MRIDLLQVFDAGSRATEALFKETWAQMRTLHEDVISRIARLGEARPGGNDVGPQPRLPDCSTFSTEHLSTGLQHVSTSAPQHLSTSALQHCGYPRPRRLTWPVTAILW